jgi:hypothetical protein
MLPLYLSVFALVFELLVLFVLFGGKTLGEVREPLCSNPKKDWPAAMESIEALHSSAACRIHLYFALLYPLPAAASLPSADGLRRGDAMRTCCRCLCCGASDRGTADSRAAAAIMRQAAKAMQHTRWELSTLRSCTPEQAMLQS